MNVGVCRRSSDETGFIWTTEVPLSLQVERVAVGDRLPLGVTMDFLSDSSGKLFSKEGGSSLGDGTGRS